MFDRNQYLLAKENLENKIYNLIYDFVKEQGIILSGVKIIKDPDKCYQFNKIELKFEL